MTISSIADIGQGEAFAYTDPATNWIWTVQRSDDVLCLESPALDLDANNRLAFLRGFLLEGLSGGLPIQSRFVATSAGTVHLEQCTSVASFDADLALASADFQRCNHALAHAAVLDTDAMQHEAEMDEPDLSPQQHALFDLLGKTVAQEPNLLSVYEFQAEHGLAVLESDEGDWVACIRPSAYADHLAILYPLGVAPDDAREAEAFLTQVLRLNSALTLGTDLMLGCVADGQTLVLKAELDPRLADANDVMELLGKMNMLADELQMLLDDVLVNSVPTASAYEGGDSMRMMMSGMQV